MRGLIVMLGTALGIILVSVFLRYADELFSGATVSWSSSPVLGSHLVVQSIPTDLVFLAMVVLGAIVTYRQWRGLRKRKKDRIRLVTGGEKDEGSQ
jgi:membrane protein implicated in regulation of membrane protease activity